jgi:hypothetical protein
MPKTMNRTHHFLIAIAVGIVLATLLANCEGNKPPNRHFLASMGGTILASETLNFLPKAILTQFFF